MFTNVIFLLEIFTTFMAMMLFLILCDYQWVKEEWGSRQGSLEFSLWGKILAPNPHLFLLFFISFQPFIFSLWFFSHPHPASSHSACILLLLPKFSSSKSRSFLYSTSFSSTFSSSSSSTLAPHGLPSLPPPRALFLPQPLISSSAWVAMTQGS